MESLTNINLEKFKPIIDNIETEQAECDNIRKYCEQLKNTLRILKLLTNPDLARNKLFQVRAKIFANTYEISDTFPDSIPHEELEETSKLYENCVYYYVEIFISRLFHEKLVTEKWLISVSVSNNISRVTKSVNVKNRVANPLCFLIPFQEDAHNVKIEACLVFPGDDEYWPILKLGEIDVDVSYRFCSITCVKKESYKNEIERINNLYNPEGFKDYVPKLLNYGFLTKWSKDFFVELILRNSYHRLDPGNVFTEGKDKIVAKLSISGVSTMIELNLQSGLVKIEACCRDLRLLKKYFGKFRGQVFKGDFDKVSSSKELKELISKLQIGDVNPSNIYHKYTTFMLNFPL